MKIIQPVDILVSANGTRSLKQALLFTVISFSGVIFLGELQSLDTSQLRHTISQNLLPVMALITAYYWMQYDKEKQKHLHITDHSIGWGIKGKMQTVEWSRTRSIAITDLAALGRQTGIIFEFNLTGASMRRQANPTLMITDYDIKFAHISAIVVALAQENNISVCTKNES